MNLPEFKLDNYYQKYGYRAKFQISSSSVQPLTVDELFALDSTLIQKLGTLRLSYPPFEGVDELINEVCTLYETMLPEHIRVMHGAEEGIFTFMNVALSPGNHIIVQFPVYQSLYEIAKSIGVSVTYWVADENNNWKFDINFLKSSISENTKAVIVNIPNSPTGSTFNIKEWQEVISICKESNLILFSDEVYRYSEFNADDVLPSACDVYENAVTVSDISKTFALPGLRIGWLASHNTELIEACNQFKTYTTITVSSVTQLLAAVALKNKDFLIKRTRRICHDNLQLLIEFIRKNSTLFYLDEPRAGTTAFVKILFDEDVEAFCLDLYDQKSVLLLPGNKMDYDNKHFRIGLGIAGLRTGLDLLQEFIDERQRVLSLTC
jgi:aspartate/methionine/tyrosine aminotransferase